MSQRPPIEFSEGKSQPQGPSKTSKGINISLYANTEYLSLGLFEHDELFQTISLDPNVHRSGQIWHIELIDPPPHLQYAFWIDETWVFDPFSQKLNQSSQWGEKTDPLLSHLESEPTIDWETDAPLKQELKDLIIYEMHVRAFTKSSSSKVDQPGTFSGLKDKISYLKELGINAIELLPITPFNTAPNGRYHPGTKEPLGNFWGYDPLHFFSPHRPYGTKREFQTMVKMLHKEGIGVILDVVFNHVDGDSLSKLAKEEYFILSEQKEMTNYTGCGNTISANTSQASDWILASLRFWVETMHVDGFRFDLASIFARDPLGNVLEVVPIIEQIKKDPILKNTLLIAEPWDAGGLYQVGNFPGGKRFAEWNGHYRDVIRRFFRGNEGMLGPFADALMGTFSLFKDKSPANSINFITAHDGFSLMDLVSYEVKHNEANGERNCDGADHNDSFNCGVEGESHDPDILQLREHQWRNFLFTLAFSLGTPMFCMGDEYGHTKNGNNNTYCQDNELNYFNWRDSPLFKERKTYFRTLINIRKEIPFFSKGSFADKSQVKWLDMNMNEPTWNESTSPLAYLLKEKEKEYLFIFNPTSETHNLNFAHLDDWSVVIDTADGLLKREKNKKQSTVLGNSCVMLEKKADSC